MEVKTFMEELSSSAHKGIMNKNWKQESEKHIKAIENASDAASLGLAWNAFVAQMSDKPFKKRPELPAEYKSDKDLYMSLNAFWSGLKPDQIDGDYEDMETALKSAMQYYEKKEAEEKAQLETLAKMQPFIEGYMANLPKLLEDAKKPRFANSGDVKFGDTEVKILVGEEDTRRAEAVFDCGDAESAKTLSSQLEKITSAAVPSTYEMSRDFSPEFAGSIYAKVWEHIGEKFADTAKQPTVTIGAKKIGSGYQVIVRVIEPVFRR